MQTMRKIAIASLLVASVALSGAAFALPQTDAPASSGTTASKAAPVKHKKHKAASTSSSTAPASSSTASGK
jgi:hypothetical protein